MKKALFLILLAGFVFSACENESDLRDDYVGEWNAALTGAVVVTMDNEPLDEYPVSVDEKVLVSKITTTEDGLDIGGMKCTLKGKDLIFEDETSTSSAEGMQTTVTVKRTGTADKNKITIKETYTGTWNIMMMMSGTISGNTEITLTK